MFKRKRSARTLIEAWGQMVEDGASRGPQGALEDWGLDPQQTGIACVTLARSIVENVPAGTYKGDEARQRDVALGIVNGLALGVRLRNGRA